jgi:L-iditol 2-dehydrogenase
LKTLVLGSFAEFIRIPARIARLNLFPKPDKLTYEEASLLEPLACVMQGMSMLPLSPDASVLVIGPGAIGLLFVAALKASNVQNVYLGGRCKQFQAAAGTASAIVGLSMGERLEVGRSFGAEIEFVETLSPFQGRGYDIVIECTGQVAVWESAVGLVRRGGTVMLFGGPPGGTKATFDTHRLHYDQITLLSPFHFGTTAVRAAREMLVDGPLDLSPLISSVRSLEDGQAVFNDLEEGKGIKYVFRPNGV